MVRCPNCQAATVHVIAATLVAVNRRLDLYAELTPDGFAFDAASATPGGDDLADYSTTDEIAECAECGEQGDVWHFGVGAEDADAPPRQRSCRPRTR